MQDIGELLENNRSWAADWKRHDPKFFERLAAGQHPKYLWIGCADSRMPATDILGLAPGEVFVHRNIANLVAHTDLNLLSVLQFAVESLGVEHVIVCGHYGCGGVKAAMHRQSLGLIDNWLLSIKDLYAQHAEELEHIDDEERRLDRLCELNVRRQVANVSKTNILQDAWKRGQELAVHGWIYNMHDGLLRDLDPCVTGPDGIEPIYRME
jgi:carbonic anhydrase